MTTDTTTPRRRHNPAWRDNTNKQRATERRHALDQIAQGAGYPTWRRLETAIVNGTAQIVVTGNISSDGQPAD